MDTNDTMNKASEAGETLNRMQETAKQKLSDISNQVVERSRAAATSTDAYVREYAWSSVRSAKIMRLLRSACSSGLHFGLPGHMREPS